MAKKRTTKKKTKPKKAVETLTHDDATRTNIPTAEYQAVMSKMDATPRPVDYPRPGAEAAGAMQDEFRGRNPDLDPQLIWRGKFGPENDPASGGDMVVQAPPLFIQEKVHPKALIDDLRRQTEAAEIARKLSSPDEADDETSGGQFDLFADFNGLPDDPAVRTEFYQHDAHWTNRMILGDSLQTMASLAEREGFRGKVQCIYLDPPYGIKFNSNFQWSTTSRDVKDGKSDHITREPEQVKAFRDTWRDGIHSYLTYLRDRLTVARDLLADSGSIFVQIGDENVHRVRAVMDEVFGDANHVATIIFRKTTGKGSANLDNTYDACLWYSRNGEDLKDRKLMFERAVDADSNYRYDFRPDGTFKSAIDPIHRLARMNPITSQSGGDTTQFSYPLHGRTFKPGKGGWKTNLVGMQRLHKAQRLTFSGKTMGFVRPASDYGYQTYSDIWDDTRQSGFGDDKVYVVQTGTRVVERCLLMATDPGDLVLDPTCGSGTTAYVAEQWGRRWITIDTSRVSLALARARIMGARYPFYLLADSPEGKAKEAELTRTELPETSRAREEAGPLPHGRGSSGSIRQGFVYERVPHITLKSIANNAEIDVIHDRFQARLEPLREQLNAALGTEWEEWEIPRDLDAYLAPGDPPGAGPEGLTDAQRKQAHDAHTKWWEQRIARQKQIDASIAAKADAEYLYDKPYEDKKKVRVAGPFTVESLSPHRVLGVDENDELIDPLTSRDREGAGAGSTGGKGGGDFAAMILEQLRVAGVQQAHKEDKITFTSLTPWPGRYLCAEGRYGGDSADEGATDSSSGVEDEQRAGIFIGPEFGTVTRQNLVDAAREAGDAGYDVVIACAFSYDAHASEFASLGRVRVLKARMNADLHMATDLAQTSKGNLFVIFGEPDIDLLPPPPEPGDDHNPDPAAPGNGPGPYDLSGYDTIRVRINGVDVFHPATGEVQSDGADGIACWFIDTDYNGESFFVRQAYFLGASDPYKSLKTTLKAEINAEAWESLHSDTSRAFAKPEGGKIAVKVINHLGDEVMKVFEVE